MSVHIEWDNEARTTILWSFVGRWTWGEFDDALKTMNAMLDLITHPIDLICDVRQMSILPPDMVSRFKSHYLKKSAKMRFLIFVGMDADLQLFWDTFTDLPYAHHLKGNYFETLDEARQFSDSAGSTV
ncbi:MAG: hypothetical protein GC204_15020 [Chloroflexi bacterium]|nr:hypothetical protein [Chloroflexota bacterium]